MYTKQGFVHRPAYFSKAERKYTNLGDESLDQNWEFSTQAEQVRSKCTNLFT